MRFTDRTLGLVKHGPVVVEAAHVGDPTMVSPKRTLAPDLNRENMQIFAAAVRGSQPGSAPAVGAKPTGPNEPPRSDQPQAQPQAPLQFENVPTGDSGNSIGATIVSAPNSAPAKPADDPNAVVKSVATTGTALPAPEAAAPAPDQVNDIKPGTVPAQNTATPAEAKGTKKKPKLDQSDEASSKKKKKKGLSKLNPF
jgi:outer membrane protein assembly factor BamD